MLNEDMVKPGDTEQLLSDEEVNFFENEGFITPKQGLDAEDLGKLRAIMKDILDDNPDMPDVAVLPYVPFRGHPNEGLIGGERLFEFAVHPTVLAVVKRLLGPNVILWGGEVLVKPAHTGTGSKWHQDGVVRPLRAGPGRDNPRGANVWIAIDDVDVDNSCLRFVPGSGKRGLENHHLDMNDINSLDFPFSPDLSGLALDEAVDAVLPAGHFSVHNLHVMHGSNPNTSGRRRVAVTFRYLDASDAFDRNYASIYGNGVSPPADIPIWLVLGENQNDRNNFMIGHRGLDKLDQLAAESRELLAAN